MPHDPSVRAVVIGASAGGVEPLTQLVSGLPRSFPAPLFVVVHVPEEGSSRLPRILASRGALPAGFAVNGWPISPGTVTVAPAGGHLVIEDGAVRVQPGPRENGSRPAIDPLFRSAARAFGSGAVGILLSGALDDGAAGLAAIKAAGGTAMVQEPEEALFPWLPRNAIDAVSVDVVLPVEGLVHDLLRRTAGRTPGPVEANEGGDEAVPPVAEGGPEERDRLDDEGTVSGFTCPSCGGAIWEVDEDGARVFRCHVGHAFGAVTFEQEQGRAVEAALWASIRALEEKASLMERLSEQAVQQGRTRSADAFDERSIRARRQADAIRDVALSLASTGDFDPVHVPDVEDALGRGA